MPHRAGSPIGSGTRAIERKNRRIASRITKALPADVRRYYVEMYRADAEDAYRRLLRGSDHVCDKCHCQKPDPPTTRSFFEMAGALGIQGQMVINVLTGLGVKSEDEARELIGSGKKLVELRAQGVSARESFETAKDLMRLSFMEDEGLRAEAIAWLNGSHAVVVDTDVSTNGGAH